MEINCDSESKRSKDRQRSQRIGWLDGQKDAWTYGAMKNTCAIIDKMEDIYLGRREQGKKHDVK